MNSVSWFIYIAQVSGSIGTMFCVLGVLGLLGAGMLALFGTIAQSCEANEFKPLIPKARWIALAVLLLLFGNLMPEKNTMYAIAASQVGEQIANSETVKGVADDATKALRSWIKRQIDEPKPEKKS